MPLKTQALGYMGQQIDIPELVELRSEPNWYTIHIHSLRRLQ